MCSWPLSTTSTPCRSKSGASDDKAQASIWVDSLIRYRQEGFHPKRTIKICSWDAEEEGLIGSTEWVEAHAEELTHAVAYLNTDVGVAGPNFGASAVPSLKQFVRDVTRQVPSPMTGRAGSSLPRGRVLTSRRLRRPRRRQRPRPGEPAA